MKYKISAVFFIFLIASNSAFSIDISEKQQEEIRAALDERVKCKKDLSRFSVEAGVGFALITFAFFCPIEPYRYYVAQNCFNILSFGSYYVSELLKHVYLNVKAEKNLEKEREKLRDLLNVP
ncbi:MAG: hypothetical protein WCK49_06920 [Myxococcaceae bacterium]